MHDVLVLTGTLLPLLGVGVTIGAARCTRDATRRGVLLVVPAAFAVACWAAVPFVWRDGNLLAAVLYLAYWGGLALYYPILLVALAVSARRARAAPPAPR